LQKVQELADELEIM